MEEVELGGLDDDDGGDAVFVEHGDEEYPLYGRDNILEVAKMIDLFYARHSSYIFEMINVIQFLRFVKNKDDAMNKCYVCDCKPNKC